MTLTLALNRCEACIETDIYVLYCGMPCTQSSQRGIDYKENEEMEAITEPAIETRNDNEMLSERMSDV